MLTLTAEHAFPIAVVGVYWVSWQGRKTSKPR